MVMIMDDERICRVPDGILADNLRQLVYDNDLSFRGFARRLGRPHKTVLHWLNGESSMRADDLKYICKVFCVSADELLGLKEKKDV